jgi:phage regulator Rha-like protein
VSERIDKTTDRPGAVTRFRELLISLDLWSRTGRRLDLEVGKVQFWLKRKRKKLLRTVSKFETGSVRNFTMLCVARPVYVRFATTCINSLHLQNAHYTVQLHLDEACAKAFRGERWRLDYPRQVTIADDVDDAETPWQLRKLRVVLDAAKHDSVFMDADTRWHKDPAVHLRANRAMFFVKVNRFADEPGELKLLQTVLEKPEWAGLVHYNTSFVSIPARVFSAKFANLCTELASKIYYSKKVAEIFGERTAQIRRLCEEISLSLAAQLIFGENSISTLLGSESGLLQTFFYGACHGVN